MSGKIGIIEILVEISYRSPPITKISPIFRPKFLKFCSLVKTQINAIHAEGRHEEIKPIDSLISFPPISPNKVIVPYYDAPVLTFYINSFDVHKVLIDPSSAVDLLQLPAFKHIKLFLKVVNSVG